MKWIILIFLVVFICKLPRSSESIPPSLLDTTLSAIGTVEDLPICNALGTHFLFKLSRLNNKPFSGNVQVTWYRHYQKMLPGQSWKLFLKLKPLRGLANPGGLNRSHWFAQNDVVASAYVVRSRESQYLGSRRYPILFLRFKIKEFIENAIHLPGKSLNSFSEIAPIISALTIGSVKGLSPETLRVFQRTGTSHLMAISGLHVGLVLVMGFFSSRCLFACIPSLLLRCPAQRLAVLPSVAILILYGLLVGFSVPTQRAVLMASLMQLSTLILRPISPWLRLLTAAAVVVGVQPNCLFSPSFYLSFMAVFWMSYAFLGNFRETSRWHQWLRLHWVLGLGLLPIMLYYFHQYAVLTLLVNAIAVPWITLLIVPLCLLASFFYLFFQGMASGIWWLAEIIFWPLWLLLKACAHLNAGVWVHPIQDGRLLVLNLLGVLLLAAPRGFPIKSLGIVCLLPLFLYFPARPKKGEWWMTVLDVGQGLSVVLETAHHTLVYDAGPRVVEGFDAGRSVIEPFLQTRGIQRVSLLMISHGDNDHSGGALWLVQHDLVRKISTSVPNAPWYSRSVSALQPCVQGQQWQWDGVQFKVLWPLHNQAYQDNNSSCVLRVSTHDHSVLLTGDIESTAEAALVQQNVPIEAEILLAPHHGSRTSSSFSFIQRVHPRYVVMSVGYHNRYRLPAASIQQRYKMFGVQILRTDQLGAIQFQCAPQQAVTVTALRSGVK